MAASVAVLLVASACSDGPDDAVAPEDVAAGVGEPSGDPPAADEAGETIEVSGPSRLLLALVTPVSADDLRLERTELPPAADHRGWHVKMEACVADAGFVVSMVPNEPPDLTRRIPVLPDLDAISKYGYQPDPGLYGSEWDRMANQSVNGENPPDSPYSDAEWRALWSSVQACGRTIEGHPWGPIQEFKQRHGDGDWYELMRSDQVDGSQEVGAALEDFATCVAEDGWELDRRPTDQGFPRSPEASFFGEEWTRILMMGPGEEQDRLQARHVATYVRCMGPVLEVRTPIREAARERYVQDNFAAFVEAERDLRLLLADPESYTAPIPTP